MGKHLGSNRGPKCKNAIHVGSSRGIGNVLTYPKEKPYASIFIGRFRPVGKSGILAI